MKLMDHLPGLYRNVIDVMELTATEDTELELLRGKLYDLEQQLFIDTATWGLVFWEQENGILTDVNKSIADRRSLLKAKIRGVGTVTPATVKSVAESWYNGQVELTEASGQVTIKFVSSFGIPSNMADIQLAVREIVPAHLAVTFVYTYNTWAQMDAKNLTWNSINGLAKTWEQMEVYS